MNITKKQRRARRAIKTRAKIRELAFKGDIPGVVKASW